MKDGTRWRGEVGDSVKLTYKDGTLVVPFEGRITKADADYLIVEGLVVGRMQPKVIFRADIQSIQTAQAAGESGADEAVAVDDLAGAANQDPALPPGVTRDAGTGLLKAPKPGVFVLPMAGSVGTLIRHDEIDMIHKEADKYGPGQIIVIVVDTYGGAVTESEKIEESMIALQKDHRAVIWIKKAISAGAMLSMCSPEIYFMTEGTCGSVTTLMGSSSAPDPIQEKHAAGLAKTAVRNGYSPYIALAMKMNKYLCSYSKDPVTGQVTFFGDLSGDHILSDAKSNLCFNSSVAKDCGFSKGTADTPEDLAKMLDLPQWYEISDYGRRIAKQWQDTVNRATERLPVLVAELQFKGTHTGDPVVVLGNRIRLLEEAVSWWRRAPNACSQMGIPPVGDLKDQIEFYRRQLALAKKAQQGR